MNVYQQQAQKPDTEMQTGHLQQTARVIDYSLLLPVKEEIRKSLHEAQQALQLYASGAAGHNRLRFCITYLHQIFGTLQMLEITGATLLADEMEKTAIALLEEQTSSPQAATDALLEALARLPHCLDSIEQDQYQTLQLTPIINSLRATRNQPLLDEVSLFNPELHINPPCLATTGDTDGEDIQCLARKLRPVFQATLLTWLKNRSDTASLDKLSAILQQLRSRSDNEDAQRNWWIMGGVLEALRDNGLADSSPLLLLLSRMDSAIKRLLGSGEDAIIDHTNEDILKKCLFYIGMSTSSGPLVSDLKSCFGLEKLACLRQQAGDPEADENITQIPDSLLADLQELKNHLSNFSDDVLHKQADIEIITDLMHRLATALTTLGHATPAQLMQEKSSTLATLGTEHQATRDKILLEIASDIIRLEDCLANSNHSELTDCGTEAPLAHGRLLHEALQTLGTIKQVINDYSLNREQFDRLETIPALLAQLRAALEIIELQQPADIVRALNDYIAGNILANRLVPDAEQLDAIADAITSIELFFHALKNGHDNPLAVLNIAQISLQHLAQHHLPPTEKADIPSSTDNTSSFYAQSQLTDIFIQEAEDILQESERLLNAGSNGEIRLENILQLERSLHTLKGSARMAEIMPIADMAHEMESLLSCLLHQPQPVISRYHSLLQNGYDWLANALDAAKSRRQPQTAESLLREIKHSLQNLSLDKSDDKNNNLHELIGFLEEFSADTENADNNVTQTDRLSDDYIRIESTLVNRLVSQINTLNDRHRQMATYIQGLSHKLDGLATNLAQDDQNTSQELVKLRDFAATVKNTSTTIQSLLGEQQQATTGIQQQLLRASKVLFSSIMPRLRRVSRVACRETGKQARLVLSGDDVEIYRSQLNHLTPALEHLIRNAISHGIETAAARQAAQKNPLGEINIHIAQQDAQLLLIFSDDGAGMDCRQLLQHAIKQGIASAQQSLTEQQILNFVFNPGFSTVSELNQTAGRGLGLDIVKNELAALGGEIHIDNQAGTGVAFELVVPYDCTAGDATTSA